MLSVNLNCDLAEGGKNDERLMPLISSCNIACGGHYGNASSVKEAVKLALQNNVKIGAHPSYPDKVNFGRKPIKIDSNTLEETLKEQISLVKQTVENLGGKLHHIKPHGALYNQLKHDKEIAEAVVKLILEMGKELVLFVPPKSIIKETAIKNNLKTFTEGFADRAYKTDLSLVSRAKTGAILHDKNAIFKQVLAMVKDQKILLENGSKIYANFDTICVHSDTPNSVEILRYLHQQLKIENIKIE